MFYCQLTPPHLILQNSNSRLIVCTSFFQQIIGEWKAKHDDLTTELGESHREMRNYHCETVRLRSFHEEIIEQLDVVKRENKNLADEIKDLLEQVNMILF